MSGDTRSVWPAQLAPAHLEKLRDSGISPEVAAERGYRTAASPTDVPDVFNRAQRKLVPALVIPVYGVDPGDEPVTFELRPDNPRTDGRTARGGQEPKVIKYEFPAGAAKVLDVPRRCRQALGNPNEPLWITEGARKADAAASIGLTAVSLAGVWAFRSTNVDGGRVELPDFDRIAFNGRDVYTAFDSDVVHKQPVKRAMVRLTGLLCRRGATVHIVVLPAGPTGDKRGLDDLIAAGAGRDELVRLVDPDFLTEDNRDTAQKLRDFILDEYELGQDHAGNGFALPRAGSRVVRMLDSGRPMLATEAPYLFAEADPAKPVIAQKTIKDVIAVIRAVCQQTERRPLSLRTAPTDDGVVLDLGDPSGRLVHITADGWRIVDEPDGEYPLFRRTENIAALPEPVPGGSLDELRALMNVTDDTWPLIKGWLIASIFGWVPRPWLYHCGPQGSAKSDAALLALSVLDPRDALDSAPRKNDRSDPAALAYNSYFVGYDNLTTISPEFSDWMCSTVTGARDSRRILLTTASTTSMHFMRTGALTGVAIRTIRPDLLERLVKVEFQRLPIGGKRGHEEIMTAFRQAHGRILGALLDAVALALKHRPTITVAGLDIPRMVDYAVILKAHDLGANDNTFDAYRDMVLNILDESGSEDAVGRVVLDYVREHGDVARTTPNDLFETLTKHRGSMGLTDEDFWPKNARGLSIALQELVASLERVLKIRLFKSNGSRWVTVEALHRTVEQAGDRDARDAEAEAAPLPASLTKKQVNGSAGADRDARDADFQSFLEENQANNDLSYRSGTYLVLGSLEQCKPASLPSLASLPSSEAGTPQLESPQANGSRTSPLW